MRFAKLPLLACIAAACLSCRSAAIAEDLPAVIANPSPESHAELLRVLSAALNGAEVTVAEDALTTANLLIVDRAAPRDLQDRPLDGRRLDAPIQFRLFINGPNCVLVNQADGRRWRLMRTRCVTLE